MHDTSAPSFTLPAALTIATVAGLREAVLAGFPATGGRGEFRLDASAVDCVDAAGIQWLVALARECQARGTSLALLARSPSLEAALGQIGLDAALAD